jgi:hypothetical protein
LFLLNRHKVVALFHEQEKALLILAMPADRLDDGFALLVAVWFYIGRIQYYIGAGSPVYRYNPVHRHNTSLPQFFPASSMAATGAETFIAQVVSGGDNAGMRIHGSYITENIPGTACIRTRFFAELQRIYC